MAISSKVEGEIEVEAGRFMSSVKSSQRSTKKHDDDQLVPELLPRSGILKYITSGACLLSYNLADVFSE